MGRQGAPLVRHAEPLRAAAAFVFSLLAGVAAGGEPPAQPILRVETTMHSALVRRLVVDPAGNRLITAGDDKTVRIWQLPRGRLARVLRLPIGEGYEGRIYALAVTPDGKTIAAGGWTGWEWDRQGAVYLFDAESGEMTRRLGGFPDVIGALAFSRDGRYLAVGLHGEGGLWVLGTSDYAPVARDREYRDKILGADFHADGRLAVVALDGHLRLYDRGFSLAGRKRTTPGAKPLTVRFSPDGRHLAVAFNDVPALAVLTSSDLGLAFTPDTKGLSDHAALTEVAWSSRGDSLYASGDYSGAGETPILRWRSGGRGATERIPAARQRIADLQPLAGGGIAFAAEDPAIGIVDSANRKFDLHGPDIADFRGGDAVFKVSRDGARVQFSVAPDGARPMRFSLRARELLSGATTTGDLAVAIRASPQFMLARWRDSPLPALNGVTLELDDYEIARTYAVSPDHSTLVLGTEWALRAYSRDAELRWKAEVPGVVRGVAVTGDGEAVVAALSDGTIRWYRMADGAEFLALFPHASGEEWIAWTPEGYYVSSSSGDQYVGWHLNRGRMRSADFYRAVQFERILYRPDIVDETFRGRGWLTGGPQRRAAGRFNVTQLDGIAPPRVRLELTGGDGPAPATLRIRAERTGLPMIEQAVFVNDLPVTAAPERSLPEGERSRFERELAVALLPGENRIRVEVSNGASFGIAELHVDAAGGTGPPPAGDLYLLAVGVNEFPALKDANLAYAARDAAELGRFFAEQAPRHFRRVYTRVVSDLGAEQPDRTRIVEALGLLAGAQAHDTVVVFLASHGVSDATGEYFFVPRDALPEDVARAAHGQGAEAPSLIRWSVFFDALRRAAGRRVLVVDTCYARSVAGQPDLQSLAKRSAAARFSLVLASRQHEESQEYAPARHGLFTHALLEGLRGAADADRDGVVTLAEAFRFAAPMVERLRDRTIGPQTPQLLAPEPLGETVLARTPPGTAGVPRQARD